MSAYFYLFCLAAVIAENEALKCWWGKFEGVETTTMKQMTEFKCDAEKCKELTCPPAGKPKFPYCSAETVFYTDGPTTQLLCSDKLGCNEMVNDLGLRKKGCSCDQDFCNAAKINENSKDSKENTKDCKDGNVSKDGKYGCRNITVNL